MRQVIDTCDRCGRNTTNYPRPLIRHILIDCRVSSTTAHLGELDLCENCEPKVREAIRQTLRFPIPPSVGGEG